MTAQARTLVLQVGPDEEVLQRVPGDIKGFRGRPQRKPRRWLSLESYEALLADLTDPRLRLLQIIRSRKPTSLEDLARIAGRPLKAVTADVAVLTRTGLVRLKAECARKEGSYQPVSLYGAIEIRLV